MNMLNNSQTTTCHVAKSEILTNRQLWRRYIMMANNNDNAVEASINELLYYIRHESSDSSSSNDVATQHEIRIRRHALEC